MAGTGDSFVPEFLAALGLKPGEWHYGSKPLTKVLTRPDMVLKVRILGVLMLQAFGYETDLAVLQKKVDDRPVKVVLSPLALGGLLKKYAVEAYQESGIAITDEIKATLDVPRQHLRRALAQMEDDGIIVRVRVNCPQAALAGLSLKEVTAKGMVTPLADLDELACKKLNRSIAIYLRGRPKPAKSYDLPPAAKTPPPPMAREVQLVFDFVADLDLAAELATRADVRREIAAYEEAASKASEMEAAAKQRLHQFLAAIAPKKEVAKHGYLDPPNGGSEQAVLFGEARKNGSHAKATPETSRHPATNGKNGNAETTATPGSSPAQLDVFRQSVVPEADVYVVLPAMQRFAPAADDKAAKRLIAACRKNADCKAVEIAEALEIKGPLARKRGVEDPVAYLIAIVPPLFEGVTYKLRAGVANSASNGGTGRSVLPPEDPASKWALAKAKLRTVVSPESFSNWLAETRQQQCSGAALIIGAPDRMTIDWLEGEYADLVRSAVQGLGIERVEYVLAESAERRAS
jgi:hypothetical protein